MAGEPIWATLEKQGGKTAILSWLGSEATQGEGRPTYGMSYDPFYARMPLNARVDTVIDLLTRGDDKRPALLTIYTPLVDDAEHAHGAESNETRDAVTQVDAMVGYLVARLKEIGAFDTTAIVIVADHGHMDVPAGHNINVDDLVDLNRLNRVALGSGPAMALWPQHGYVPTLPRDTDHLRMVAKGDLPKRFHNSTSDRAPPFLLVADPGYVLCVRSDLRCNAMRGMHGYDNAMQDMHAFFLAAGPGITSGAELNSFENVDVYSLLSHLLRIKPVKTDGSIASFCRVLIPRPDGCGAVR